MTDNKYILQATSEGQLTLLGSETSVLLDGADSIVQNNDAKRLVRFYEFLPEFTPSQFEQAFQQASDTFAHLQEICGKDTAIRLKVREWADDSRETAILYSDEFPKWRFSLLSSMIKKYGLEPDENGGLDLYVKQIERNWFAQVTPESPSGKLATGKCVLTAEEVLKELDGHETEPVNVRICDIKSNFIIVSYKGFTQKVTLDNLYFPRSDKKQNLDEYRPLLGKEIPMFYFIKLNRPYFSEMRLFNREQPSDTPFNNIQAGDTVEGYPIAYKMNLGVFVWLSQKCLSLLHVFDCNGLKWWSLRMKYPLGVKQTFIVKQILDGTKIGLRPADSDDLLLPIFRQKTKEDFLQSTVEGISEDIVEGQLVEISIGYADRKRLDENGPSCFARCGQYRGILQRKYPFHSFWNKNNFSFVTSQPISLPAIAHVRDNAYEFCIEEAGINYARTISKEEKNQLYREMTVLASSNKKILLRLGDCIGVLAGADILSAAGLSEPPMPGTTMKVFLHHINKDGSLTILSKEPEITLAPQTSKSASELQRQKQLSRLDRVYEHAKKLADDETVIVTVKGLQNGIPLFTIYGYVGTFSHNELSHISPAPEVGDIMQVRFTKQFKSEKKDWLLFEFIQYVRKLPSRSPSVPSNQFVKALAPDFCRGAYAIGIVKSHDEAGVTMTISGQSYTLSFSSLHLSQELASIEGLVPILFPIRRQCQLQVESISPEGVPNFSLVQFTGKRWDAYYVIKLTEELTIVKSDQGVGTVKRQPHHRTGIWIGLYRTGYSDEGMLLLDESLDGHHLDCFGLKLMAKFSALHEKYIDLYAPFPYCEMGMKTIMPIEEWEPEEPLPVDGMSFQGLPLEVQITDVDIKEKIIRFSRKAVVEDTTKITSNDIGTKRFVRVTGMNKNGYTLKSGDFSGLLSWKDCGYIAIEDKNKALLKQKRIGFLHDDDIVCVTMTSVDEKALLFEGRLGDIDTDGWKAWASGLHTGDKLLWTVDHVSNKFIYLKNEYQYFALITHIAEKYSQCSLSNHLQPGDLIQTEVCEVDADQDVLRLFIPADNNDKTQRPSIGETVEAVVQSVSSENLIRLDGRNWIGVVRPSDIVWGILPKGEQPYVPGNRVRCKIMEWNEESSCFTCSIKELKPRNEAETDLNRVYRFSVTEVAKSNIYMVSKSGLSAILPKKETPQDSSMEFVPGMELAAMIREIDYDKHVLICTKLPMENLVLHGAIIDATVIEVGTDGITLGYKGLESFVEAKDLGDTTLKLTGLYNTGDIVRAMVISYTWQTGNLKLNVKAAKNVSRLRKGVVTIGATITATVIIVEQDRLVVSWEGNYGIVNRINALAQRQYYMNEVFRKGQVVEVTVLSVLIREKYFTATTHPDYDQLLQQSGIQKGMTYPVVIIRQESDFLVVSYNKMRGTIPNEDLYWGIPYKYDDEAYSSGKTMNVTCLRIDKNARDIQFHYDKGEPVTLECEPQLTEDGMLIIEYQGCSYPLQTGATPSWVFLYKDTIPVTPCQYQTSWQLRHTPPVPATPPAGQVLSVSVLSVCNEGITVLTSNNMIGYIPKEELGWLSTECQPKNYQPSQVIDKVVCVNADPISQVVQMSIRDTIPDPLNDYHEGMMVDTSIMQVTRNRIIGFTDDKNAVIEKAHAGWKYQFEFSESLSDTYHEGDTLKARIIALDRDNNLLMMEIPEALPTEEDFMVGRIYNARVVSYYPDGLCSLPACYLMAFGPFYGLMLSTEAYWQPLIEETRYRPEEEIVCNIYGKEPTTGLPLMSHRRMLKGNPLSSNRFTVEDGTVLKAHIVDVMNTGLLITLDAYNIRTFLALRYLYTTRKDYDEQQYQKGMEIDIVCQRKDKEEVKFRLLGFKSLSGVPNEGTCQVTIFSISTLGYNAFTSNGYLGWLPASLIDFGSYLLGAKATTTNQHIEVGTTLTTNYVWKSNGLQLFVDGYDTTEAISIGNHDVTDFNNIHLELGLTKMRGCVYQNSPLPYFMQHHVEEEILSSFYTNFGKIDIPDGVKMKVKFQKKNTDGTLTVSILKVFVPS